MELNTGKFSLAGLSQFNIILGKNGCGKSHLLKQIALYLRDHTESGLVRYITPERSGYVFYQPHVEQNMTSNASWLENDRRKNQAESFKHQSAVLYKSLETDYLRKVDSDRSLPPFSKVIEKINSLLDRVQIESSGSTFRIKVRETNSETSPSDISSGESELISLAIEILAFSMGRDPKKPAYFLMDEPDVHLHPDLQYRLGKFLIQTFKASNITLIVVTHSTAFLSAFEENGQSRVAFMKHKDESLTFEPIDATLKALLPIFGAHPLSNIFNEAPILLVEGEDDERIWQQAIRSSKGNIRVFPCPVDSIDQLASYEAEVNKIVGAVYDKARAYSLRDRDVQPEAINDIGYVKRMRLGCRAAENLLLSDDVLNSFKTDWPSVQTALTKWASANKTHKYHSDVKAFIDAKLPRKNHDLKSIRNILAGLLTNKPWEVAVGQAIAQLVAKPMPVKVGSLRDFLGQKVCETILRLKP